MQGERTIRTLAKELAGTFYEQKRSDRFRSKDSKTRAKMLKQMPDGTAIEIDVVVPFQRAYPTAQKFATAHWPLFYDAARKCMIAMLAMPEGRITAHMKDAIAAALIEDREKQNKHEAQRRGPAQSLIQVKM